MHTTSAKVGSRFKGTGNNDKLSNKEQCLIVRETGAMLKLVLLFLIVQSQAGYGKKHKKPATTLEAATTRVSVFLRGVKDFFEDMLDAIADLMMGLGGSKKKKTTNWSDDFIKYAKNSLKSGYKMVENVMPVLEVARSTIDDVGPILPNVTTVQFFESLLKQIVPDLMKKQGNKSKA